LRAGLIRAFGPLVSETADDAAAKRDRKMNARTKAYPIAYAAAALVMLGLDSIWLTLTANSLYRPLIGELMLDGFRPAPAIAFYTLYLAGIVVFAIRPAFATGQWRTALVSGALFGLFAYGTYDLTNQATLKIWSTTITLADMAWGSLLTAVAASAGYLAASRLTKLDAQ
jgi:uncharacterized membrane protein